MFFRIEEMDMKDFTAVFGKLFLLLFGLLSLFLLGYVFTMVIPYDSIINDSMINGSPW